MLVCVHVCVRVRARVRVRVHARARMRVHVRVSVREGAFVCVCVYEEGRFWCLRDACVLVCGIDERIYKKMTAERARTHWQNDERVHLEQS